MRILQLSDPHLLADPDGRCRGRQPLPALREAVRQSLLQIGPASPPDLLLISGDLCQDESWGGYVRLRELLESLELPVALLPGNHDQALLLRAVLGRRATVAPALLPLGPWQLLLLASHRPGQLAGWLGSRQRIWLEHQLAIGTGPLLVALHHPPLPIGASELDAIGLRDAAPLLRLLAATPRLKAVLFGHVHQHWQGLLPGRPDVSVYGCPSTLCGFGPVQPCPLERPEDPGGRLLELLPTGEIRQRLLRWPPLTALSVLPCA